MDEQKIRQIVRDVVSGADTVKQPSVSINLPQAIECPVEVSARHIHLTRSAVATLFGAGESLVRKRDLSQKGEFLSEQRVKLVTPAGELNNVAVLGPERDSIQVELSKTDCLKLGVNAPVNISGDLKGAGDVTIIGPKGVIVAEGAVIVAKAHLHAGLSDAEKYGFSDGEIVSVKVSGQRPLTFEDVVVRIKESFTFALHIDSDEANACAAKNGDTGVINRVCRDSFCSSNDALKKPSVKQKIAAYSYAEKVMTEADAKKLVKGSHKEIIVCNNAVLTPSAKDVLSGAGISVTREE